MKELCALKKCTNKKKILFLQNNSNEVLMYLSLS